ncbi:unnamed protein product [Ectocarpus fasciculatus]
MTMTADEQKRVCQSLSRRAAYEPTLESLRARVEEAGAELLQTWAARNGTPGYWAFTARIRTATGGSRWMLPWQRPSSIFVLVFRGTLITLKEFLDYVRMERYRPLFGDAGDGEVYDLWIEILEQIWDSPADDERLSNDALTMRQILWKQFNENNGVWISGHSKGGALATTCAARLVLGRVRDDSRDKLRQLSVLTFNAPKALCERLATDYERSIRRLGVTHRRLFNEADRVRDAPPFAELRHVGCEEPHGNNVEILRDLHPWERVAWGVAGVGVIVTGGFLVGAGTLAAGSVYFYAGANAAFYGSGGAAIVGGIGMVGGAVRGGRRANA